MPCRLTLFSTLKNSKPQLQVDIVMKELESVVLDQTRVNVYEPRVSVCGRFKLPSVPAVGVPNTDAEAIPLMYEPG